MKPLEKKGLFKGMQHETDNIDVKAVCVANRIE